MPKLETVVRVSDVVASELGVVMPEPETVVRISDVVASELGVVMPELRNVGSPTRDPEIVCPQ
jgi:hypothetical protein